MVIPPVDINYRYEPIHDHDVNAGVLEKSARVVSHLTPEEEESPSGDYEKMRACEDLGFEVVDFEHLNVRWT